MQIFYEFFVRFTLRRTAGYGRNFSPIAALFRFVNYYFYLHTPNYTLRKLSYCYNFLKFYQV